MEHQLKVQGNDFAHLLWKLVGIVGGLEWGCGRGERKVA